MLITEIELELGWILEIGADLVVGVRGRKLEARCGETRRRAVRVFLGEKEIGASASHLRFGNWGDAPCRYC